MILDKSSLSNLELQEQRYNSNATKCDTIAKTTFSWIFHVCDTVAQTSHYLETSTHFTTMVPQLILQAIIKANKTNERIEPATQQALWELMRMRMRRNGSLLKRR